MKPFSYALFCKTMPKCIVLNGITMSVYSVEAYKISNHPRDVVITTR